MEKLAMFSISEEWSKNCGAREDAVAQVSWQIWYLRESGWLILSFTIFLTLQIKC